MRAVFLAATAAMTFAVAGAANATTNTVYNSGLGSISPGTTTTDVTGTRSTNPGGTLAGETPAFNQWEQQNVRGNGVAGITTDYARSGNGSIFFSTDGSAPSKADMEYYFQTPVLLSQFNGGSYDWLRDGASTINPAPAPAYRLMLASAGGAYEGYGIWEPYLNDASIPTDTWTTESITANGSKFWWNNLGVALPAACANRQACLYTIDDILNVNTGLVVTGISVGVGSGWTGGTFRGAVDNVSYNFGDDMTSFNFEVGSAVPEPATWALLILGFGGVGAAMRHRRRREGQTAAA